MKAVNSFGDFMALVAPKTKELRIRGQKLYIRELSDRQRLEVVAANKEGPEELMATILAFGLINSNGDALLTLDQARGYGEGSTEVLTEISAEIMKLSGLGGDEEDIEPGKDSTQLSDSSTD